jgi:hypothetical protein
MALSRNWSISSRNEDWWNTSQHGRPKGLYYTQDPEWFDERRALILKSRREGQTLASIGEIWGISDERVRQLVKLELIKNCEA